MENNDQAIIVNVKLEKEDVGEYSAIILKSKMRLTKRQVFLMASTIILFLIVIIYTLLSGAVSDKPTEKISNWPILILVVLIIYRIGAPIITKILAMRQFETNKQLLKTAKYTFSTEGIQVQSETRTVQLSYSDVFKLIETKQYFALLESSQSANVIPKRCISSEEELQSIIKLLKDRIPEKNYEIIAGL